MKTFCKQLLICPTSARQYVVFAVALSVDVFMLALDVTNTTYSPSVNI